MVKRFFTSLLQGLLEGVTLLLRGLVNGFFLGTGFLCAVLGTLIVGGAFLFKVVDARHPMTHHPVGEKEAKVAVVELTGEIFEAKQFARKLQRQVTDTTVKGIVVYINTPGGDVGASEELYRAIRLASRKKPVVCAMGSTAASGGLYAAMGCKHIVANENTFTGSIGVIATVPNISSILERVDVSFTVIKSGALKDVGSPLRPVEAAEREYLQSLVMRSYEHFLGVISTSRGIPIETVRGFADGRIILGDEAVGLKLVDEIGDVHLAATRALEQASGDKSPIDKEPSLFYPKNEESFLERALDFEESAAVHLLKNTVWPRPVVRYLSQL
jgi:protease-4